MTKIRNFIYLIVFIGVAIWGIGYSLNGLFIALTSSTAHEVGMDEVAANGLFFKRKITIQDACVLGSPMRIYDEDGSTNAYIYSLFKQGSVFDTVAGVVTNIIYETQRPISDSLDFKPSGVLSPFYSPIDEQIVALFESGNVHIGKDVYYLKNDTLILQWYWYALILFITSLFIFRLTMVIVNTIKDKKNKKSELDSW